MATTSISLSLSPFLSKFKPKSHYSLNTRISPLQFTSPLSLPTCLSPKRTILFHHSTPPKRNQIWSISATTGEVLPSDTTTPVEQIVTSTGDDVTSNIIQVLLFIAFAALSILTIGVIYIAVTDFLQKREGDKFDKEEAAKKKKSRKKSKMRARAGPKGFGQKVDVLDDDNDD